MRHTYLTVPLLFVLAACATPAIQPDEDANHSSSMNMAGSGTTTYTNDGYGFSVTLPAHFEAFKGTAPVRNKKGAYIKDGALEFEGSTEAFLSLKSQDTVINASFGAYVNVFPLEGYNRIELYDSPNYEYLYDAKTDTWTGVASQKQADFDTRMIGGKKAYVLGFGDAGQSIMTYAVPVPEKNVMLEFVISDCAACTDDPNGLSDDKELVDANYAHIKKESAEILDSVTFAD